MEFWSEVLERIRWKIPKASYDMWFARTEAE
ncbi:DnaA N-terminal domain-containing protein [Ureibacillus sp. FSL K6-2830]